MVSMRIWLLIFVFLAGSGLPVQFAVNSRLRQSLQAPLASALISFAGGTLLLVILNLLGVLGRGRWAGLSETPWWTWLGGIFGVLLVVASIIGLPRLGSGTVVALVIAGQLVAGLLLDHFGWLGVPRVPVNPTRLLGTVLLFAGALMIRRV